MFGCGRLPKPLWGCQNDTDPWGEAKPVRLLSWPGLGLSPAPSVCAPARRGREGRAEPLGGAGRGRAMAAAGKVYGAWGWGSWA